MRAQVAARLNRLRREFDAGRAKLTQLETEEAFLRERLVMLKGAIQVLEELQAEDAAAAGTGNRAEISARDASGDTGTSGYPASANGVALDAPPRPA